VIQFVSFQCRAIAQVALTSILARAAFTDRVRFRSSG
jgi:hypothetical protein